ncbi:MAG TPA: MFS transporter [Ktedonobacterales bacterium]
MRSHSRSRYWQTLLVAFLLGWVFMYADRTVLSPVLASIGAEWQLNRGQLGLISSIFFFTYAALQIPTGLLADRFGRKLLLVPGYVLFGVATLLSALAPSYGVFLLLAACAGLGEGTYYPTQFSLSSEALPARIRGLGSAIINSGQAFGISLGLILSGFVAFNLGKGWRASFAVMGAGTLVVAGVLALLVREHPPMELGAENAEVAEVRGERGEGGRNGEREGREASAKDTKAEGERATAEDPEGRGESVGASGGRPPAGDTAAAAQTGTGTATLLSRDLVLVYIAGFCSLYGFFVIITWLPYYLQVARHVPATQTGIISSFVPWASLPGALLLSYLSDRWHARRALALGMLPVAALAFVAIPLAGSTLALYAALALYGFTGKLALDPILVAYVADRVPKTAYSRAYALLNFAGMSSSILAPVVTGALADATGTLNAGFYLSTALLLVGMLCMALTRPESHPKPA